LEITVTYWNYLQLFFDDGNLVTLRAFESNKKCT